MLALVAVYLVLCLLVGFIGRNRQIGFAGFFVLSILLSPFVMALVYLLGTPRTSP
jgi:Na+/proline symporter